MIALSEFLAAQPILSLFLAVALGYAVGQINIAGFSLGIGAVLFVGLAIGALVPKAQIIGPIGLIGLTMFLASKRLSRTASPSPPSSSPPRMVSEA